MAYDIKEVAKALKAVGFEIHSWEHVSRITVEGQIPQMTNGGDEVMIKLHTPISFNGYASPIVGPSKRQQITGDVRVLIYHQSTGELYANIMNNGKPMLVRALSCSQTLERKDESELECIATDSKEAESAGNRATAQDAYPANFGVAAIGLYGQNRIAATH